MVHFLTSKNTMSVRLLFASVFFKEIVRKKLFESYKTWVAKKELMKYSISGLGVHPEV